MTSRVGLRIVRAGWGAGLAGALTCGAAAEVLGLVGDSYTVSEGGQTYSVIDLFVDVDEGNSVFLVFGTQIWLSGADAWFHSDPDSGLPSGGTWMPTPSIANPLTDSFVTIGAAPADPPTNMTFLDPNFDDSPAGSTHLGNGAGWFNANPPNFQGKSKDHLLHDGSLLPSAVRIGRFSIVASPSAAALHVDTLSLNWSWGALDPYLTEEGLSGTFQYVPAPGGLMLVAGVLSGPFARRRRR